VNASERKTRKAVGGLSVERRSGCAVGNGLCMHGGGKKQNENRKEQFARGIHVRIVSLSQICQKQAGAMRGTKYWAPSTKQKPHSGSEA
jgi:hypothetical protein